MSRGNHEVLLRYCDLSDLGIYRRGAVRGNLHAWAQEGLGPAGQTPARHHVLLLEELEKLTVGIFDRLMILMPPGSAKSTYATILFPAWWFTQYPRSSIITASHSAGLAAHFSRRVRDLISRNTSFLDFDVAKTHRAAETWSITSAGEYFAVGVRGAIAGRRADLIIVDDPVKSQADAENSRQRDFVWDWFRYDLTTRLRPGGKIVLIMTRWHPDDLAGRILAHAPTEWRILRLPALAEPNDPLGRPLGAALWPEWEDREALLRKRYLIGERAWSALFQQDPHPSEGRIFAVARLEFVDSYNSTNSALTIRAWDLAATGATGQNDPDWTVGLKLAQQKDGRYVIVDVVRIRGTSRQVEELIVETARRDGPNVLIGIPEDPGQAGKSQMAYLVRQLAGYNTIPARESGSKATRAMPVASQVEAGNISILRADWNRTFVDEARDFPFGRKDDQVDALVRAFTALVSRRKPAKALNIPLFGR